MLEGIFSFIKEARGEFNKVVWPSREEAVRLTLIVVATAAVIGLLVTGLDYFFSNLVKVLIGK